MRRMRGIGLVLVDKRCGRIGMLGHAIGIDGLGRAGQGHEPQIGGQVVGGAEHMVSPGNQRVIRLQRDKDRAVATLVHQIKAMVKELAKDRHDIVEGRRQADIGRMRLDDQTTSVVDMKAKAFQRCGKCCSSRSGGASGPRKVRRQVKSGLRNGLLDDFHGQNAIGQDISI